MELKDIREKIDSIDEKMTKLFIERMNLAKQVALIKKREGLAVRNVQREKDIIISECQKMPEEIKGYGKRFYEMLFDVSRAYQSKTAVSKSDVLKQINEAIAQPKPFPMSATVACQGVLGAYSQLACDKMVDIAQITYFKDWFGVFAAVEKGLCQYGVLPIENSFVGSVNGVYDLMLEHKFYIVKAVKLKINHCLLASTGVELKNIKEIYSHEKALSQCEAFIKKLGVKTVACENTAVAAKIVSESGRDDVACICSAECASIYNLEIIRSNLCDGENNYTRFILISKKMEIYEDANKISVMVNLAHEAGSLNTVLNSFSTLGLNLTKLESRPLASSAFEFAFYFDFEASIKNKEVQGLIAELDNSCKLVFLGGYAERGC